MLYIVATPIGNLDDMTPRAIEVLNKVDLIAAEDTRHSRKLCQNFSINTEMLAYQQHNEIKQAEYLINKLKSGLNIAMISDAGTPLISDPGYRLVQMARAEQIDINVIPGACAAITALSGSGLATDRFLFEGFLPAKHNARIAQLESLQVRSSSMIFYETPHRIVQCLADMSTVLGEGRQATVARELTKLHESWYHNSLHNLYQYFNDNAEYCRGEIVIVVAGCDQRQPQNSIEVEHIIATLAKELPPNKAAAIAAKITGINKKELYQRITGI